jgi:NADH-quinone oxidoreductase subunit I
MEQNKSYFGELVDGVKTLATGMKVTLKEYFTAKSTEQYPENPRQRCMWQVAIVVA